IYVTNHADEKISTSGSKGTVTITAGETKKTINLMPHGDNALKGSGVYAATSDMEVVASVTMPGMPTKHARFTPLAKSVELQKSKHAGHAGQAGHTGHAGIEGQTGHARDASKTPSARPTRPPRPAR